MMFKQRDRQQKGAEMRGKKRGAAGEMQKLPMGAKTKKAFGLYLVLVLMLTMGGTTVFAAGDPIAVVYFRTDPCHRYDFAWVWNCTDRVVFKVP